MANSLELIRVKITELEARLAHLRIAERELIALDPESAHTPPTPRRLKLKPMRTEKAGSAARQTISGAIVEVLSAQGALPAAEIAENITARGREVGNRTISHSLQALKKQGRVRIRGGKWMLVKARRKRASAQ
jgi:hypothetical protein